MSGTVLPEELWYRDPPPSPPAWWSRRARFAYGLLILGIGVGRQEVGHHPRRRARSRPSRRCSCCSPGGDGRGGAGPGLAIRGQGAHAGTPLRGHLVASDLGPPSARSSTARGASRGRDVAARGRRRRAVPGRNRQADGRGVAPGRLGRRRHTHRDRAPHRHRVDAARSRERQGLRQRSDDSSPPSHVPSHPPLALSSPPPDTSSPRSGVQWPPPSGPSSPSPDTSSPRSGVPWPPPSGRSSPSRDTSSPRVGARCPPPPSGSSPRPGTSSPGIVRPVASTLETVLTAIRGLVSAAWPPILATVARVLTAAANLAANVWRPLATAAAKVARALAPIGQVVGAALRRVWSTLARGTAHTGHFIATTWATQRVRLSKALSPAGTGLLVVELAIVGAALGFSYVWGWWLDGERVTGVVVEAPDPRYSPAAAMTIRDPFSDDYTEVAVAFGLGATDVGDSATAVVMPSNPSRSATPATLAFYLALWMTLPLAALVWPVLWRRRWRQRWRRTWGPRCSHALPELSLAGSRHDRALRGPADHPGRCRDHLRRRVRSRRATSPSTRPGCCRAPPASRRAPSATPS